MCFAIERTDRDIRNKSTQIRLSRNSRSSLFTAKMNKHSSFHAFPNHSNQRNVFSPTSRIPPEDIAGMHIEDPAMENPFLVMEEANVLLHERDAQLLGRLKDGPIVLATARSGDILNS